MLMSDNEYRTYLEEKSLARLQGVVIGATGACVTIAIIHLLIYLGL